MSRKKQQQRKKSGNGQHAASASHPSRGRKEPRDEFVVVSGRKRMSTAPEMGQWHQKKSGGGAGSKRAGGNNNDDNEFEDDNYLGGIGAHADDDESSG